MKKIFYSLTTGLVLSGLALVGLIGGCTKVNDQFNQGLYDSLTRVTNKATYNYTMTEADYKTIGTAVQKPIASVIKLKQDTLKIAIAAHNIVDSTRLANAIAALKLDPTYVMGGSVTSQKYLPNDVIAGNYVPLWLNTTFKFGDVDSKTLLGFNAEYDTLQPVPIASASKFTLITADYSTMKVTALTGGAYFDSKYSPTYFIPTWLNKTTPYAVLGDVKLIHYKYNIGTFNAPVLATRWLVSTFDGTSWGRNGFTTPKTLQYVFKADGWHLDPTVSFTMSKTDYDILVQIIFKDADRQNYLDSHKTAEFWWGASAYFGEFNIEPSTRTSLPDFAGLSAVDLETRIWNRIAEGINIVLKSKFPLAVTQVNGIDVHYKVTYAAYVTSMIYYTADFKCISNGTSSVAPEFELITIK